jgi:glycosyltransferase involved in cell wall biosynthesis
MSGKEQVIFYVPSIYPCQVGGYEVYNYHLTRQLLRKEAGFEVLVFTTCREYLEENGEALFVNQRIFWIRRYGLGGLSAFFSILFHPRVHPGRIRALYASYVGGISSETVALLLLFRTILRVPYMLHIHGGGMRPWGRFSWHRTLFRHARRIAGVSEVISQEYGKRTGARIDTIWPVVPFARPGADSRQLKRKHGLDAFDRIILFVGSLKPLKCPEILLKAFMELDEAFVAGYNPALLFCGDGELKDELIRKYRDKPHFERVFFLGNVPNALIPEYYAISDLYVIPSWFEGTPIALMQAMSMGVPSIGTRVRGISSLIEDGYSGLLIEKDNASELKEKMVALLSGEIDAGRLSANASAFIRPLVDYEKHLEEMIQTINTL